MSTISAKATKTITAVPAGRINGKRITKAYTYRIDREPEVFGQTTSRIFAENRSHRHPDGRFAFTPTIVVTSSIREVTE